MSKLCLSQITSSEMKVELVNVTSIIHDTIQELHAEIEACNAQIDFESLPQVQADAKHLQQLFKNLIGNAIKFRSDNPVRVTLTSELQNPWWLFAVKDNGIGIEPQHYEKVFVIFQRLHSRSKYAGSLRARHHEEVVFLQISHTLIFEGQAQP